MKRFFGRALWRNLLAISFVISEIAALMLLVAYAASYYYLVYFLSLLANALVVISLVSRDVNPEFKITWLVVVIFLPFVGGLLYIMFYSRRLSRAETRLSKRIAELHDGSRAEERDASVSLSNLEALAKLDTAAAGQAMSLLRDDTYSKLYCDSSIKYFPLGEQMFESLLSDLRAAERFIFLEYFIIHDGEMWRQIFAVLKEKVREGIEVRIIYDDLGSMSSLPEELGRECEKIGIRCVPFGRVTPSITSAHNNRDHRKICSIDNKIAYTGGVNISDEYINKIERFGHWKDGGVRIEGRGATGFTRLFLVNYSLAAKCEEDPSPYLDEDYPVLSDGGFYIPFGDGPAPLSPGYTAKNAIMNMINQSQSYLYVTTPYLVIDYDLTEALRNAAKRGVDVRIITPGIPDKKVVKIMTKSAYPYLLAGGVRIFEYAEGFIHEKTFLSDGKIGLIGSVNLDYRSLVHHFEDALWIYGSSELAFVREELLKTMKSCREIDERDARLSFIERCIRGFVKFFAPLL